MARTVSRLKHTLSTRRMDIFSICSESRVLTQSQGHPLSSCSMESPTQLMHGSCSIQTRLLPSNFPELVTTYGLETREDQSTASVTRLWAPNLRNTGSLAGPRWANLTHRHRLRWLSKYLVKRRWPTSVILREPHRCSTLSRRTLTTGIPRWTSSSHLLPWLSSSTPQVPCSNGDLFLVAWLKMQPTYWAFTLFLAL